MEISCSFILQFTIKSIHQLKWTFSYLLPSPKMKLKLIHTMTPSSSKQLPSFVKKQKPQCWSEEQTNKLVLTIHCACHTIVMPLRKTFLQGLSHPWVRATLNCFWNCQPTSSPKAMFRPALKLFLHQQSKHGSFTQAFWTELVPKCLTIKEVVTQKVLQNKMHKILSIDEKKSICMKKEKKRKHFVKLVGKQTRRLLIRIGVMKSI